MIGQNVDVMTEPVENCVNTAEPEGAPDCTSNEMELECTTQDEDRVRKDQTVINNNFGDALTTPESTSQAQSQLKLKGFSCSICGCVMKRKSNLSRHMKEKHGPIIYIKCDLCDASFARKFDLVRQKRVHERDIHSYLTDDANEIKLKSNTKTNKSKQANKKFGSGSIGDDSND